MVLIFHAFPLVLLGGFIGVYVFFVISGYLITGIILKVHDADHLQCTAAYYEFVRKLQSKFPEILVYNHVPLLCDAVQDVCLMQTGGQYLYSYGDPISDIASSINAKDMLLRIQERWPVD